MTIVAETPKLTTACKNKLMDITFKERLLNQTLKEFANANKNDLITYLKVLKYIKETLEQELEYLSSLKEDKMIYEGSDIEIDVSAITVTLAFINNLCKINLIKELNDTLYSKPKAENKVDLATATKLCDALTTNIYSYLNEDMDSFIKSLSNLSFTVPKGFETFLNGVLSDSEVRAITYLYIEVYKSI